MENSIFISTKAGLLSRKSGGKLTDEVRLHTDIGGDEKNSVSLPNVIIDNTTKVVRLSIAFINNGSTVIYKSLNLNK